MERKTSDSLLAPFRVLDLTDEKGFLCGRVLGDFGADVIKVEPPGGDPGRAVGPFYHDIPDPEKSLYWMAYNANKRGITLNIEAPKGRPSSRSWPSPPISSSSPSDRDTWPDSALGIRTCARSTPA